MSKNRARQGKKKRSKKTYQTKRNKTSQTTNLINEQAENVVAAVEEEAVSVVDIPENDTQINEEVSIKNDESVEEKKSEHVESADITEEPAQEETESESEEPTEDTQEVTESVEETTTEPAPEESESETDESDEPDTEQLENTEPEESEPDEPDVEQPEETKPEPTTEEEPEPETEPEEPDESAPSEDIDQEPEDVVPEPADGQAAVKKPHTGLKAFFLLLLILAYCGAAIYGIFQVEKIIVNPDKFHQGTVINGIDVSGMDTQTAEKELTEKWNNGSISILNSTGSRIGEIKDFDFKYNIDDSLESIMKPGAEKAILHYIKKDRMDYTIQMKPADTTEQFDKQFNSLSIVEDAEGDKPSKNAYIDKSDTEFRIVKEVYGNSVDTEMLKKAIFESIARGENTFQFRRDSFHKAPEIVSNSPELLEERDYCRKYLSFKLRYRNSVNDYTVTPEWLDKMMKVTEMGKVKVNEENIEDFINNVLYPKFSSVGDTRRLTSAGGGKYTVTGGTYGFTIDVKKEENLLKAELKDREDVEREPNYSGKKPTRKGVSDIGDDFVEVSIAKQRVWVVKNGKTIVDTSVVTGNVPRHNTPTGVYYIVYKATNTVLKGHNDDGSEYESHVAYWMPFYLGYGLHDASWRGAFGGSIYLGNGSHGCVNCPPSIMPKIFKSCYTGMPVIVH